MWQIKETQKRLYTTNIRKTWFFVVKKEKKEIIILHHFFSNYIIIIKSNAQLTFIIFWSSNLANILNHGNLESLQILFKLKIFKLFNFYSKGLKIYNKILYRLYVIYNEAKKSKKYTSIIYFYIHKYKFKFGRNNKLF